MNMKRVALSVWMVPVCALVLSAAACEVTDGSNDPDASTTPESDASTTPESDASTTTDGAPGTACYTPTPSSGKESKSWNAVGSDEIGEFTITAPADPGGGYLEVEIKAENDEVRPWIEVTTGDGAGAIINGSSAGNEPGFNVPSRRVTFAAAPGQTYKVRAWQFFSAPPEAYPVSYSFEWKFTSLVDCYEPNDTAATAKPVAFSETIEAYATAGYTSNNTDYTRYADWYSFTLTETANVNAELVQAPGTLLRMGIKMFDEGGTVQLGTGGGNAGGELFTSKSSRALEPGKYTFRVETATSASVTDGNDFTPRSEWTTPYRVKLTQTP